MPAKSEKQRRFMGAVKSCKMGGTCSGMAKKAATNMTLGQVDDYLRKGHDKQSS